VAGPATILESLVLSVAHYWSCRETWVRQVELLDRHFRQDEMLHALVDLCMMRMLPPPTKRQQTVGKTATRSQAEDVVNYLKKLGDANNLPRFMVQSDDLPRVMPLLAAVSVSDERSVSARLEALEAAQQRGMEEMKRMISSMLKGQVASRVIAKETPTIEVSQTRDFAGVARGNGGGASNGGSNGSASNGARNGGSNGGQQQSFFYRQGRVSEGGRRGAHTDRSPSVKRVREGEGEGEWRKVTHKQKSKPKIVAGTADLSEFGDLAGPVQFWIGNTHPATDSERVEQVLMRCAESLNVERFCVDDVRCLTKDENPRVKSWRVTVPARLKDTMENPAMYARGWSHRVFSFRPGPMRRPEAAGAGTGAAVGQGTGAAGVQGAGAADTGATLAVHP
jgi:hypothetical protein